MVQANQTELLGNKSFLTVGVERPESLMPVGGGVKYACSLPFGDGVFSLEVYKFISLEEVVVEELNSGKVEKKLKIYSAFPEANNCLYIEPLAPCGRGQDFELSAAKLRNPGEGSLPGVHNQHALQFPKTHPSRFTPHASLWSSPRRPL